MRFILPKIVYHLVVGLSSDLLKVAGGITDNMANHHRHPTIQNTGADDDDDDDSSSSMKVQPSEATNGNASDDDGISMEPLADAFRTTMRVAAEYGEMDGGPIRVNGPLHLDLAQHRQESTFGTLLRNPVRDVSFTP